MSRLIVVLAVLTSVFLGCKPADDGFVEWKPKNLSETVDSLLVMVRTHQLGGD